MRRRKNGAAGDRKKAEERNEEEAKTAFLSRFGNDGRGTCERDRAAERRKVRGSERRDKTGGNGDGESREEEGRFDTRLAKGKEMKTES